MTGIQPSRDELVRRFERWLDDAIAAEDPPSGVDEDLLSELADGTVAATGGTHPPPDSYTLWAAMTALTHEVKLQGRAFKELHTTLGTQEKRIAEVVRAADRDREGEVRRLAERRTRREGVSVLIDLRDRLGRGLASVRAVEVNLSRHTNRSWWHRLLGHSDNDSHAEAILALEKGYELGLERLDQTLEELNTRPIRAEGQPFDPQRMNALDKEASSAVPEGTVLEVYQTGYEWGDEVFRPAQVKVAVALAAAARGESSRATR